MLLISDIFFIAEFQNVIAKRYRCFESRRAIFVLPVSKVFNKLLTLSSQSQSPSLKRRFFIRVSRDVFCPHDEIVRKKNYLWRL